MTDWSTRLNLMGLLVGISLFIFFTPWVLGQKQPAIEDSVKQNMDFFKGIVEKYYEKNKKYPENLSELRNDARQNRYNKTLFNPILKNGGDLDNTQIVAKYSEMDLSQLDSNFKDPQFQGKVGYYSNGQRYLIYGHVQEGQLLTQKGQVLVYGNF